MTSARLLLGRCSAVCAALLLLSVVTVPTATPAAAAGNIWVSKTGCSDNGPGSNKLPMCSITAAAAAAVAGQTVRVGPGTYVGTVRPARSGLPGAPIRFQPEKEKQGEIVVTGGLYGFALEDVGWITVTGFSIRGTVSNGIYLNDASNVVISNVDVRQAGLREEGLNAAGMYVDDTVDSTISANLVSDNSGAGIYLTGSSTRNVVSDNETTGNAFGWQRNGTGIDVRAPGNTITRNRSHHNEDSGIQLYPGADNSVVTNNVSYANKGFTTTPLANCSHPATGNTAGCFTGDHGIDNLKVTGNRIVGNTVYGNTTAGINYEGLEPGTPSGTLITNNISADNAIACPDGAGGSTSCPGTGGNVRVDATSGTGTVVDRDVLWSSLPGSTVMAWGNLTYRNLADVRAVSGQETTGRQADPLFVNAAAGDFRLRGGSPAIDMADSAVPVQPAADITGRARADDVSTPNTGTGPRAFDDAGAHEYPPVPGAPSATGLAGTRQVALTWSVPPAGGTPLVRFTVYRGTSPSTLVSRATTSPATTTFTDTQVTAWTRYYYAVTASNADGESLRSPTVVAVPTGPPIAPSAPVVTATSGTPNQATLSWTPPDENGSAINRYVVYRGTTPQPTTQVATLTAADTSWTDTGLVNGTTYYYRVRAGNSVGLSAFSADASAMPTSITVADTVTKPLTAGVTSSSLPLPAATAEGDLLVALLAFTNATSAIGGMDGWTPVDGSPSVDGTLHTTAAYYKLAGPAETSPTVTWTTTSKGTFAVAAYRGVDPGDPVGAAALLACDLRSAASVTTPALVAPEPGEWAVALFASRSSTASQKDMSWLPGPGLTERLDQNNSAALSSPWTGVAVADSGGAVPMGSHAYSAAPSFLEIHHHSALLYLNSIRSAP